MKSDEEPAHPIGWHDDVPDKQDKLSKLVGEINSEVEECEACAI